MVTDGSILKFRQIIPFRGFCVPQICGLRYGIGCGNPDPEGDQPFLPWQPLSSTQCSSITRTRHTLGDDEDEDKRWYLPKASWWEDGEWESLRLPTCLIVNSTSTRYLSGMYILSAYRRSNGVGADLELSETSPYKLGSM